MRKKTGHTVRLLLWIFVIFGMIPLSLSIKVNHIEDSGSFFTQHKPLDKSDLLKNWIDYILTELADTGEEIPGKHCTFKQQKVQTGKRILFKTVFFQPFYVAYLSPLPEAPDPLIAYQNLQVTQPASGFTTHLHRYFLF